QGLCARHNLLKETNHTTTYPEPSPECTSAPGTGTTVHVGQNSHDGPGREDGRGDQDGEAGHGRPDGHRGQLVHGDPDEASPSGPGGGAVITILGGGMKFTSPARAFPTESPTSVAEDHYWRGYREGRADQRQQQHEREHELQTQENAIYTVEDRLRQLAARLLDNGAA
ncbi:MAG: hypothetical protein ACTMIK_01820, partial [Galactobacter sp.]